MASITYVEVRRGMIIVEDGQLFQVMDRDLKTPGNLPSKLRLKLKNLKTGFVLDKRVHPEDKVEQAYLETRPMQYLYQDGEGFHFMNQENYEQIQVPADVVGDYAKYLQEGMVVSVAIHEGTPVSMEIPQKVTLEIVDTEPVVKGQTASGSFKPATLSNGVRTMVPTHIVTGTRVVISTADGSYVERAKD